jgi:hypothetical protein
MLLPHPDLSDNTPDWYPEKVEFSQAVVTPSGEYQPIPAIPVPVSDSICPEKDISQSFLHLVAVHFHTARSAFYWLLKKREDEELRCGTAGTSLDTLKTLIEPIRETHMPPFFGFLTPFEKWDQP